ncbi:Uma2 family endonuclease [Spirulina sp. CCNP1310]|uniref:Uma2 family endonuclease n=1 Tax=Spirulina sp. CCNP1310 TaxID=3110249 RepID=UPI003A4C6889
MQIALEQLVIPPGRQLLIKDISWQMYEDLLADLGEKRGSRINYSQGILEIMTPLPEHEDDKVIIGNLVEILLEELDIEFRNLASTTFKSQSMKQGIEADQCFYIENEAAVRGQKRIDLSTDPPPDLAIEIDITSRTRFDNYESLGVGELWRFNGTSLEINVLQDGVYFQSEQSPHFPGLFLTQIIPDYLERSKVEGRNKTMKAFRAWVRDQI